MEYLVNRNYGNFIVGEYGSDKHVSVMISPNTFENLRYGGALMMDEPWLQHGLLTYFKSNPAYRKSHMDNWTYTSDEATILTYVFDMTAYIIIGTDRNPVLVRRDYTGFERVEVKVTNNVVKLHEFRAE